MKWIYVEGKFIPVQNCVNIDFNYSEKDKECFVIIIVEDVNGNLTKSIYYSKVEKLHVDAVRNEFYNFIKDTNTTMFDFNEMCSTIEQLNS